MSTPQFAMRDTKEADGCYLHIVRVDIPDESANPGDYLFQDEAYRAEDQKRLDAYERGEWSFIGIRARAIVHVVSHGVSTEFTIESAGVWGVESDSGEEYLAEIFDEEKSSLQGLIAALANPIYE